MQKVQNKQYQVQYEADDITEGRSEGRSTFFENAKDSEEDYSGSGSDKDYIKIESTNVLKR
jgi:hypothetical protein